MNATGPEGFAPGVIFGYAFFDCAKSPFLGQCANPSFKSFRLAVIPTDRNSGDVDMFFASSGVQLIEIVVILQLHKWVVLSSFAVTLQLLALEPFLRKFAATVMLVQSYNSSKQMATSGHFLIKASLEPSTCNIFPKPRVWQWNVKKLTITRAVGRVNAAGSTWLAGPSPPILVALRAWKLHLTFCWRGSGGLVAELLRSLFVHAVRVAVSTTTTVWVAGMAVAGCQIDNTPLDEAELWPDCS